MSAIPCYNYGCNGTGYQTMLDGSSDRCRVCGGTGKLHIKRVAVDNLPEQLKAILRDDKTNGPLYDFDRYAIRSAIEFFEGPDMLAAPLVHQIAVGSQNPDGNEPIDVDTATSSLVSLRKSYDLCQERIKKLSELLADARNGLQWYQANHPEDSSPADDQLMDQINIALAAENL